MMTKLRISHARAGGIVLLFIAAIFAGHARLGAVPAAPAMNPAVVLGPSVTLSWTSVPGATSYRLAAGAAPGQTTLSTNVGNVTQINVSAPFPGTYYARIFAIDATGEGPASGEVPIVVTSMSVPPAAPTNMAAFANGRAAVITWDLGTGGGTPTTLLLHAGTAPGGSDAGIFPVAVGTQLAVPSVNPGNYYLRVQAVNQGGQSGFSNEVNFNMPVGGACSPPPARAFTAAVFGRYVQFAWQGVPGAAGYRLDFTNAPGAPATLSLPFGPATTSYAVTGAPLGVYYGNLVTTFSCGQQTAGPEVTLTIDGAPPAGPRTPNPAPGERLPFRSQDGGIVSQLARDRPDLLRDSCREHGGNNRFMFEALRRLRAVDNRYGLNWKRGLVGDLSQDIINYNNGSDSDEGTQSVYIIDIIGGHCGSNPTPNFQDQTAATRNAGTIGIWTIQPYLAAGFPIVSDEPQR
jgi:hypothetical protein